jgi:hypothetical protein
MGLDIGVVLTRAAIVGLIVEWAEWLSPPLLFIFFVLAVL